jgi:hypothetical protein
MPSQLSDSATTLLRQRLAGERVDVTDLTRPAYRELADAGLMEPLHSFSRGNEGAYRLTDAACDLREGLTSRASRVPSA